MSVVAGVEMVSGRADPAERRVTAEADRKVDQLGGSGRSTPRPPWIRGTGEYAITPRLTSTIIGVLP